MTQKTTFRWKGKHWLAAGALLVSCGLGVTSCDKYDLDERAPEGWDNSIYQYMSQRNFSNMVRMIDELGERDVLNQTGSKTFFAADDEAFARFYANNPWGVTCYEDLTLAQKAMIVRGSMVNNSYQMQSLSSVTGDGEPLEGECMRRLSALSVFDSVPILTADKMPDNPYWAPYKELGSIACMRDMTSVPMVHFIEAQLVNKRITNEDVNFLYNKGINRQPGDASVNGMQVVEPNIRCTNGFIHRVNDVMIPLANMAEVVNNMPEATIFNKMLQRFCAPYYCGDDATKNYNAFMASQGRPTVDSLFQMRFFSLKSQNGRELSINPNEGKVPAQLNFDPGWNEYFASSAYKSDAEALQRDMAVIMVPTDEALTEYWNGAGSMLRDRYHTWEGVPDDVIIDLINNNLQPSFIGCVPSKFDNILNDANDPMGIKVEDVKSVTLACNGAVYLLNKVFSPTRYVSVLYPAVVDETLKVMNWGVEQCQYNVYLNSLNSTYSFFIPTANALLEYIDPVSYGKTETRLFRFHYDDTQVDITKRVWAEVYNYDVLAGMATDFVENVYDYNEIKNRLKDILETHIVIGAFDETKNDYFYRTKGGMEIRVRNAAAGAAGMTVEGSYQVNEGMPVPVTRVFPQANGKTYILDGQPILGTRKSVLDILEEHPEFSKFAELLDASGILEDIRNNRFSCATTGVGLFNNYHYTVYVPSNEAIQKLQDNHQLPTLEELETLQDNLDMAEGEQAIEVAKGRLDEQVKKISDFVKYHIQDNAVFINSDIVPAEYETGLLNESTKQFVRLKVTAGSDNQSITVTDGAGKAHHVVTAPNEFGEPLYNLQAREYLYDGTNRLDARTLATSSTAVIHYIDNGVLMQK